jgi:hypothetical protein
MKNTIEIVKHSGNIVAFDVEKLIKSLNRSQVNEKLIQQIIEEVQKELYDGITTKQIYKMAFKILKDKSIISASKYKLKKAIMELGPSGFPFEKFASAILKNEGFDTKVGVIVQGKCVQHEVDVVALKDNKHYMVECKYHSHQGRFCNVKIPLYIQSRFLDIEAQWKKQEGHETRFHQGWVFTNTRFSTDAIQYANCAGLKLLSWDYPLNFSLKNRIDALGLHPITCLFTLTKKEKKLLLNKGFVLSKDLCENPDSLISVGINKSRQKLILKESQELCKYKSHD